MFFKKTIAGIAALTTIASMSGFTALAAEDNSTDKGYKTGSLKTYLYSYDDVSSIDCRYYDALPSVPYVKLTDFYKQWCGQELEVKNNNDGTFEVKVPIGTTGTIDIEKDTISSSDINNFIMPEDEATATSSVSDLYVREDINEHQAIEGGADLGAYHLDILADNDDIWFPVPTLCDIYVTPERNPFFMDDVLYFGGELMTDFSITNIPASEDRVNAFASVEYVENSRPQDIVEFNYNELCFSFDMIYGYPGRPYFTPLLKEKGLDGMLSEGNDTTQKIKELLLSKDAADYTMGFNLLNNYLWDGGHTQFGAIGLRHPGIAAKVQEIGSNLNVSFENAIPYMEDLNTMLTTGEWAKAARDEMIKDVDFIETVEGTEELPGYIYCEKGDVAFFSFDGFASDKVAWDNYYHNDGQLPVEVVSGFYKCVEKADKNPKITKFVVDMGTNTGGDSMVLAYLMGIMADVNKFDIYDPHADMIISSNFKVDKNFDKVIDEKDAAFKTDLKFGVISSKLSFSCGNLFPSMAHDNGMVLMGEKSGGGSCAIQVRLTADGNPYVLSSGTCLIDKNGNSIDLGIEPDFNNVKINEDGSKDFSETYNFANISKCFDEFYHMTANTETTTTTTTASSTSTSTTTTTETTSTTSASTSEKSTESTTSATTTVKEDTASSATTTKAEEQKYFAPLTKMGEMAAADYKSKNGTAPADSVLKDNGDGSFSIILSDDKGNVLDTYTIDPATGKGKDSKGNDVDLPQTGNNSVKTVAAVAAAAALMTVGAGAAFVSGVGRKKKDNE